ncbi:MAG TPA: hypothetical protein VH062_02295 [Polyangiaceae bacterium]|jgi:hypothetical protein|nr:hypothetical protein [Polyangiaceae bacterium]
MTRIKIVCAAPKTERLAGVGPTMITYPSGGDVKVLAIDDDGTERDISGSVCRVTWEAKPNEVPRAMVEFLGAEIDAEGVIESQLAPPREQPPFPSPLRRALREHDERVDGHTGLPFGEEGPR